MVEKKGFKRGSQKGFNLPYKLSKSQEQILKMLMVDYLTPKQIAGIRKTSVRAVYKTIEKLKKKGAIRGGSIRGFTNIRPPPPQGLQKHYYRLHGMQLHVEPVILSERYKRLTKKTKVIEIAGNKIILYNSGIIEIYQQVGASFMGQTIDDAMRRALDYWNKIIYMIENDYNILILKDRKANISIVSAHLAEVENEMAIYEHDNFNEKITIYGKDGKAWFKIDNSWHLNEAETIHPKRFKEDAQVIFEKQLNDWRENDPRPLSVVDDDTLKLTQIANNLVNSMGMVTDTQKEISNKFAYEMNRHMKLLNDLQIVVTELKKSVQLRDKLLEKLLRRLEDV